jgi:hypothetical protein
MQVANLRYIPLVLLAGLALACGQPPSTDPIAYTGEYIFTPHQKPPPGASDFLVLRSDGTAIEVRYSPDSGQLSTIQTQWAISEKGPTLGVNIGDFRHSVKGAGSDIRLYINDDLNEFYQKIRSF